MAIKRKLNTQSRRWHPRVVSPRLVQYASCLVRELTSPRDVQSASWRIRELSSNHIKEQQVFCSSHQLIRDL